MGKKNGSYSKDYGKVVGNNSKDFPGWKGPSYVKKAEPRVTKQKPVSEDIVEPEPEPKVSSELQQNLLNVFRNSFPELLDSDTLKPLLQEVKTALYERDFSRAFGKEEYLEAYSVRWSPSRALCYNSILVDIEEHLNDLRNSFSSGPKASICPLNIVCFGGGAAEVVAFGGFTRYLSDVASQGSMQEEALAPLKDLSISEDTSSDEKVVTKSDPLDNIPSTGQVMDLCLVDCANWKTVVQTLHSGLTTPPPMSKYASASARAANKSLIVTSDFSTVFHAEDVLVMDQNQVAETMKKGPLLLTLLFTLNELYTSSIAKTTAFLLKLTMAAQAGTLLLVVDSPGSYSEATVGSEAKKYPMHWLLNHTLIGVPKAGDKASKPDWEMVISDESRWFRIPEGLRYPISLENMRYQIHLYRRL
jgi:25S rRNA (uracil2843-N3)-methyltransferase